MAEFPNQALAELRSVLTESALQSPGAAYLEEPRGRWRGKAAWLAMPETTEQCASIMRIAHRHRVPVVPYSGGTGLVGGQISADLPGAILLSTQRMNKLRDVSVDDNVIVAEAGVILTDIHDAATDIDRLFPLSLASQGSARIGGLLATNAGGLNVLRYGNARALVLGLEVVTPTGEIWNGLSRLRKDNTGYDLKDLFIGSEGTLGVITAAALRLEPLPKRYATAMMAVASPRAALDLLAHARDALGETISAFELIHRQGLDFLAEVGPEITMPFEPVPEWMVLIDVGQGAEQDPDGALADLFEKAMARDLVDDGVLASSHSQRAQLWAIRENIPEANRRIGSVSSHDISVPISAIPSFIQEAKAKMLELGDFRVNCFGHLGDGNLHFNIFPPKGKTRADFVEKRDAIKKTLHEIVLSFDGSISAEHGIGRLKVLDLEQSADPTKLSLMRSIKSALDPAGIMNPGAVLRVSV